MYFLQVFYSTEKPLELMKVKNNLNTTVKHFVFFHKVIAAILTFKADCLSLCSVRNLMNCRVSGLGFFTLNETVESI